MKRVLLVTFDFPPVGGSGVQRVAKFAKYLPQFGWQPVVLTTRHGRGVPRDPTLLADVGGCETHRTHAPDPHRLLADLKRRFMGGASPPRSSLHWGHLGPRHPAAWLIPDGKLVWLPFGVSWALSYDQPVCDVVLSSLPTPTTAILGSLIARHWRVPHVVDYRDPWSGAYYMPKRPPSLERMERAWERRIVAGASAVCAVPEAAESLPRVGTPTQVIHNGFDESDFANVKPKRVGEGFVIAHIGVLWKGRDMGPLSASVRILRERRPDLAARVHIVQIGRVDSFVSEQIQQLSGDVRVSALSPVTHAEAIACMVGADLLYLPTSHDHLPGKTYEYLRSGTPVLGVGDERSHLQRLVAETGGGIVIDRHDSDAIARCIEGVMSDAAAMHPADSAKLERYSREAGTDVLAQLLDQVASESFGKS